VRREAGETPPLVQLRGADQVLRRANIRLCRAPSARAAGAPGRRAHPRGGSKHAVAVGGGCALGRRVARHDLWFLVAEPQQHLCRAGVVLRQGIWPRRPWRRSPLPRLSSSSHTPPPNHLRRLQPALEQPVPSGLLLVVQEQSHPKSYRKNSHLLERVCRVDEKLKSQHSPRLVLLARCQRCPRRGQARSEAPYVELCVPGCTQTRGVGGAGAWPVRRGRLRAQELQTRVLARAQAHLWAASRTAVRQSAPGCTAKGQSSKAQSVQSAPVANSRTAHLVVYVLEAANRSAHTMRLTRFASVATAAPACSCTHLASRSVMPTDTEAVCRSSGLVRDWISDLNLVRSTARTGHVAVAVNAGALNSSALTHAAARSGRLARAHIVSSTAQSVLHQSMVVLPVYDCACAALFRLFE
jgi:hypothetical protein